MENQSIFVIGASRISNFSNILKPVRYSQYCYRAIRLFSSYRIVPYLIIKFQFGKLNHPLSLRAIMMPIIEKILAYFIAFSLVISHNGAEAKKRICIIGTGRVGLAAIKLVADQIDKFEPIAFERNADVGGLWIYTDEVELDQHGLPVHSSIYKNLKTITPKETMAYPDYQSFNSTDDTVFVPHETFLQYMKNYTDHFLLRKYVQFNTLVKKVTPVEDGDSNETKERWRVEKQNLITREDDEIMCDAIMICSGRFSKPYIPDIPGMGTFRGQVLHSRSYRRPEDFVNKYVIILGAQASGVGITRDLSPYAKKIYLSSRYSSRFGYNFFDSNVNVVDEVVKVKGSRFILQDNSSVYADVFIFCTGFLYDFPFLDETSGIVNDGRNLHPLHKNFMNMLHPSMAFIGIRGAISSERYYWEISYFLGSLENNKKDEW